MPPQFRQNSEDAGVYESQGRDDIDEDDVEMYFNYMGMLANEGSYDRMQKFFEAGIHPCDIILLMACEEGDTPKIEELIKAGADTSVKDWQGKTCMELAANDKVWRATDATPPLVRHRCPMHVSLTP